ncbi:MAG: hypothetical protein P4N59_12285 [Negativicutes bacterium]|nr:hypothetical protein [Negativicutes bacterium]
MDEVRRALKAFWQSHPEGRIETGVTVLGTGVLVKAQVFSGKDDAKPIATGHARSAEPELNKSEELAISRALTIAGYNVVCPDAPERAKTENQQLAEDPGEYEISWKTYKGPIKALPAQKLLWLAANYTGKDNEAKIAAKAYLEQHPEVLAKVGKTA